MNQRFLRLNCIIFFSLFLFSTVNAKMEMMEKEIMSLMAKYRVAGLSLAVVKDGRIIYTHAFGYKDLNDSIVLKTDDIFRIASLSKSFVGTAVIQLSERGKLSLDDDVNNYLDFNIRNPKFPDSPITIRMLLCHRSSINDSLGYKTFNNINPVTGRNYEKCYNLYSPGCQYSYSNLGFNLLGAVIEKVSGMRFDRYIKERIIEPLKLNGSFNTMDLDSSLFAKAYNYDKRVDSFSLSNSAYKLHSQELVGYKLGYSTPILSPAGGMKTTAPDMARYMMMHINQGSLESARIISKQGESVMRKAPKHNCGYALSLYYHKQIIQGETFLGHTGRAYGIYTAMFFHPKKKYGFVVFCNGMKSSVKEADSMRIETMRVLYNWLINNKKLEIQ